MTDRWILASSAALILFLGLPAAEQASASNLDANVGQVRPTDTPTMGAPTMGAAGGTAASSADAQRGKAQLQTLDPKLFPLPPSLESNVAFWVDIFSRYDNTEVVLHDELHIDVVYDVIDLSRFEKLDERTRRQRRQQTVRDAKQELSRTLRQLAAGEKPTNRVQASKAKLLLAGVPGGRSKYKEAALRVRSQTGLRNVYAGALHRSGRYLPWFEAAFREQGLPIELTRIPFVESMFQETARSAVAAAGMWQFMPSTGKLYLAIDMEKDERYDPIRASAAAAQLLGENYKHLGNWPLAITAYNHGRYGMARAKRSLGTSDLGVIVQRYKSRTFGFASRNFYAEFVAAALVYMNRQHYFPDVEPAPLMQFDDFRTQHYVSVRDLAGQADVDLSSLKMLNPGLNRDIWKGDLLLPKDYLLRVPPGTGARFQAAYASLPNERKMNRQLGVRYKVRRGDTLGKIARRFGTSVGALQRSNRLRSANQISVGQVLLIPPGANWRASSSASTQVASKKTRRHTVRRGDSLGKIASRYGISIRALKRANNLSSNTIYPRQVLVIP